MYGSGFKIIRLGVRGAGVRELLTVWGCGARKSGAVPVLSSPPV